MITQRSLPILGVVLAIIAALGLWVLFILAQSGQETIGWFYVNALGNSLLAYRRDCGEWPPDLETLVRVKPETAELIGIPYRSWLIGPRYPIKSFYNPYPNCANPGELSNVLVFAPRVWSGKRQVVVLQADDDDFLPHGREIPEAQLAKYWRLKPGKPPERIK